MATTKITTAYIFGAFLGQASERVDISVRSDTAAVATLNTLVGEVAVLRAQVEVLCGQLDAARRADDPGTPTGERSAGDGPAERSQNSRMPSAAP